MTISFLITAIIVLLVVGLLIWCIDQIPGLPAPIPAVIKILVVLCLAIWLLERTGVLSGSFH